MVSTPGRPFTLILAASLLLGGCTAVAGAAVATGVTRYHGNKLTQVFPVSTDEAWEAALVSMRQQGYRVPSRLSRVGAGNEIMSDDARVTVEFLRRGMTRVEVRVGTFQTPDSIRRAEQLLDDIAERLEQT